MCHTEKQFLFNLGDSDWTDTWLDIIPEEILQIIYKEVFKSTLKQVPFRLPLALLHPPRLFNYQAADRPSSLRRPVEDGGTVRMCIKPAQTKSLILKANRHGGGWKGTTFGGDRPLAYDYRNTTVPKPIMDLVKADSEIVAPCGETIGFGFKQFLEYTGVIFKLREIKFNNTFDDDNNFRLTYTSPNDELKMVLGMSDGEFDNKPFLVKNKKQFPQITIEFHATITMLTDIKSLTGYYNHPPMGQTIQNH